MHKKLSVILMLLFAAALAMSCAKGDTGPAGPEGPAGSLAISFQQGLLPYAGYSGAVDTGIDSLLPDANYGASTGMPFGLYSGESMWILVKFDISFLQPASVIVEKAYIVLTRNGFTGSTFSAEAFRATATWDEGTRNSEVQVADGATWNNRTTAFTWAVAGGDFDAASGGGAVSLSQTSASVISIPVKASMVQGWLANPSENYGIIIKASNTPPGGYTGIFLKEAAAAADRPRLLIYYRP